MHFVRDQEIPIDQQRWRSVTTPVYDYRVNS
jgi:hypothetical protein